MNNRNANNLAKMVNAAVDIQMNGDAAEIAYMARALVQATLPHSDPGDVPVWGRRNGNLSLLISPGYELDKETREPKAVGIPYGTIPRLLLFWITTEVVRTGNRRLELGESLSAFMRELGLTPTGGRWGTIPRLREQMNRLFRAKISFDLDKEANGQKGNAWLDMPVAPKGELWWSHKTPEQGTLWQSWIELGEDFYEAIKAAPVPVDMRALKALKRSPMALDLYAWMNYRTYTIQNKKTGQFIPWAGLQAQLGADYGDQKDFKKKAKAAINKVVALSPGISCDFVDGGIKLYPGKPAITIKPSKRKISAKD
jgi:hypothetical protein